MKTQPHTPTPMEAVDALAALQERTGLNLAQISRKTDTPAANLWNWSKGKTEPRYSDWVNFWAEAKKLPDAKVSDR